MPNFRNIQITDNGTRWDHSFEYEEPPGSGNWQTVNYQYPRDLSELPGVNQDNYGHTEAAFMAMAGAIARQQGLWE